MSQSLKKPGRALVLDLINIANALTFVESDFTWGQPVSVTGRTDGRNTAVEITSTGNNTLVGSQTLYYNRLDLTQLFNGIDLAFEDVPELVSTQDIIDRLNAQFELALDETDIVIEPLVRDGEPPFVNVLKAQPGSYAYIGEVTFKVGEAPVVQPGEAVTNGFFFINTTDGKLGASIETLTDVEDPELPLASNTSADNWQGAVTMVTGGYQNEIFGLKQVETSTGVWGIELHYSTDGGETWDVQPLLTEGRLENSTPCQAVFFKGLCYFFVSVSNLSKLMRIVPTSEGTSPYAVETTLELGSPYALVTDQNQLMALDSTLSGTLHFTTNGVDWTQELTNGYVDLAVTLLNGELYMTGWNAEGTFGVQRRAVDGTYTEALLNAVPGRGEIYYLDYAMMFAVDNDLYLVGTSYFEDGATSGYLAGDVYKGTNRGETWELLYGDTGFRALAPPADDGEIVYVVGMVDEWGDTGGYTQRMMTTTDRGVTWTFDDAASFPFLVDATTSAAAVVRQSRAGDMPATQSIPPYLPNLVADYPFQVNGTVRSLSKASDDRVLLGGAYSNGAAFTQVNEQTVTSNFCLLDANGQVIDTSEVALTNVLDAFFIADNQILVIGGGANKDNTLIRLNNDLSVDTTFTSPTFQRVTAYDYPAVTDAVQQPDGKIIIAGNFNQVNGTAIKYIARLNVDGSLDTTFTSPVLGSGYWGNGKNLALLPSGRIILTDYFSNTTLLLDSTGGLIRTGAFNLSGFSPNRAFELANGDIWLCNGSIIKWTNTGLVVNAPVSGVASGAPFSPFYDLGSDTLMTYLGDNSITSEHPLKGKFCILDANGNLSDAGIRAQLAYNAITKMSNGSYIALVTSAIRQEPYPRYNTQRRSGIARFYPNTEDLPAD